MSRRDIRGPGVGSIAIVARPIQSRRPDHDILERRKAEEIRQQAQEKQEFEEKLMYKRKWELRTDKMIVATTINRKVKQLTELESEHLEARRNRLRDLLQIEEQQYLDELAATVETPLERQAKMRDRAKALREEREAERTTLAEQKQQQLWLESCEAFRTLRSKQNEQMLVTARDHQLQEKMAIKENEHQMKKLYAELWEQDRLEKEARDERDRKHRSDMNAALRDVLDKQTASREENRRQALLLREEEKRLRLEEAEMLKQQERQEAEKAQLDKAKFRRALDRANAEVMQARQKEMNEQLAYDLALLESVVQEAKRDHEARAGVKQQKSKEIATYLQYLGEMKALQAAQGRELERLQQEDMDQAVQKQLDRWNRERLARERLMAEVAAVRKEQIKLKLERNEEKQRQNEIDYAALMASVNAQREAEEERHELVKENRAKYAHDLVSQADENKKRREEARLLEVEEALSRKREEDELDRRMQDELAKLRLQAK